MSLTCTNQNLEEFNSLSMTFSGISLHVKVRWEGLTFIDVSGNSLIELPLLPDRLVVLRCGRNLLVSLPPLPCTLKELEASDNHIASLPILPKGITKVNLLLNNLKYPFHAPGNTKVCHSSGTSVEEALFWVLLTTFIWSGWPQMTLEGASLLCLLFRVYTT